jgi:hypothetical protein
MECRHFFPSLGHMTATEYAAIRLKSALHSHCFQDGIFVEYMARCPSTTKCATEGDSFAKQITVPERLLHWSQDDPETSPSYNEIRRQYCQAIRDHIANNMVVIAKGWKPALRSDFSIDGIYTFRPTMNQPVRWQGLTNIPENESTYSLNCRRHGAC